MLRNGGTHTEVKRGVAGMHPPTALATGEPVQPKLLSSKNKQNEQRLRRQ